MFLRNYTSDVPAAQTIARIEKVLIQCGVTGITKEYAPQPAGVLAAITFTVNTPEGKTLAIRLPADKEACQRALWLDYVDGDELDKNGELSRWHSRKKKKKADFAEQAERTAWRLVQDWIEIQLSMIQMQQADFAQVFLPYVWDGRRTFYDALKADNFRLMLEAPK